MIVVTGTKRSGTSMWMQILAASGLEVVGEAFPRNWGKSIRDANQRGFFESRLRGGIFYGTNPDPNTGAYLHPKVTRNHAVKVFIPGLIKTDHAFLYRVIATIRPWREYTASLRRLYNLEDEFLRTRDLREGETELQRGEIAQKVIASRGGLPMPIEWWFEVYDLVRDIATRRYSVHLSSYPRLLADPEAEVRKVLEWVGEGDWAAGASAVAPDLRTQVAPELGPQDHVEPELAALFDEIFEAVHVRGKLPISLVGRMNETQNQLRERYAEKARRDDTLDESPAQN